MINATEKFNQVQEFVQSQPRSKKKKNEVNIIVILPGWSVSILKHHIQKDMGIFVVFLF